VKSLKTESCILRVLICCFLLTGAASHAGPGDFDANARPAIFNKGEEFPSFFLPQAYRNVPADKVPAEVVAASRVKMEQALASVFKRLTIPIVPEGEAGVRQVRYFEYVQDKVGGDVHIMPSGGVVRSSIGYLYNEIYDGMNRVPTLSPEEVLERIINEKADLPGFSIRGIGSDFDVLVKGPDAAVEKAIGIITTITNSAETHYGARESSGMKRALFTVGDVKKYEEQIGLSTRQGGATVDFLAYDLKEGRVVEPVDHDYIVSDLIRGEYRYIAPSGGETIKDTDKQTIRGVRSLVELPFLTVRDSTRLKSELQALITKLKKGDRLTSKSIEQFDRIIRNARLGGAHNRIYRGEQGSIESLLLQVNDLIRKNGQHRGIPEFVDSQNIAKRNAITKTELNGVPRELLTPVDRFIDSHTDKGVLYHGTPDLDFSMAIMRGGLFISGGRNSQGTAVMGRGGYSSWIHSVSLGYAGGQGLVFHLPVKKSEKLNILNLQTHGHHPALQAIRKKAEAEGKDFHEVLAREHGIDIIINHHVLLQNLQAVELPKDPGILMRGLYSVIENPHSDALTRWKAFVEYRRFFPYAQGVGLSDAPEPPNATEVMKLLKDSLNEGLKSTEGLESRMASTMSRAYLAQPELKPKGEHPFFGRYSIYETIDYEMVRRIEDKGLQAEVEALRTDMERTKEIRSILANLAQEGPLAFIEVFPGSARVVNTGSSSIEVTPSGILNRKDINKNSEWEQALVDLSARTRAGAPLLPQDQIVIRYLIRHSDNRDASEAVRWLGALLGQAAPKYADMIIDEIKHGGEPGAIAAARLVEENKGSEQKTRNLLRAALGKDPKWAGVVKDLYLKPPSHYYAPNFPWNLKDAGDLRRLSEIGKMDSGDLKAESSSIAAELRDRYGLYQVTQGSHNDLRTLSEGILNLSIDTIPDPDLRERTRSVRNRRRLARSAESLRKAIGERDPQKAMELFPGFIPKNTEKVPYFVDKANQGHLLLNKIKKDGKKGLTAAEQRVVRETLAGPTRLDLKDFYKALLESPDMGTLIVNRFRKPLVDDGPQVLVEILQGSERFGPELKAIAREQAEKITGSISRASFYYTEFQRVIGFPWDLEKDRAVLLDLHKGLASERDLNRRWREVIAEITQVQPAVISAHREHYLLTSFSIIWDPISNASAIDDPALRQRFINLYMEKENRTYVRRLMDDLTSKQPLQMLLQYPEFSYAAQKGFNLEIKSDGISKHPNLKQTTDLEEAVLALSNKLKAGTKLNEVEGKLLDYFVRHGTSHEKLYKGLAALLSTASEPGIREMVDRIKSAGRSGQELALTILSNSSSFPVAHNMLRRELGRDPTWRAQVRAIIPTCGGDYQHADDFPWNLSDAADKAMLRAGLSLDTESSNDEIKAVIRILRDRYGLVSDRGDRTLETLERYKFSIRPEMIPDLELRARFEKALSEHLGGLRVRQELSKRSRKDPAAIEKAFPGFVPDEERLSNGQLLNYHRMQTHLKEKGFAGLPVSDVRFVRQMLQRPFQADDLKHYVAMLSSNDDKPRAAALSRLRAFKSGDSAAALLELLGHLDRDSAVRKEVAEILGKPEVRAELFAFARSPDPVRASQLKEFGNFPWDYERDAEVIEALAAKRPEYYETRKQWRTIHGKIGEQQPGIVTISGRDAHYLTSVSSIHDNPISYSNYIDDPALREEYRKVLSRRTAQIDIGNLLNQIARKDALSFTRQFPNLGAALNWDSNWIEVKEDGSIQPISHQSKPTELDKMFVALSVKTRTGGRLSQKDKDLLRYLFQHAQIGGMNPIKFTVALLGNADDKSAAKLWKIYESLQPARPELLMEFLGQTKTKDRALTYLAAHPKLRDQVRKAALVPGAYKIRAFPWDLTNEGDLKAMEEIAKVNLEEDARHLDDILLELRNRYEFKYTEFNQARSDLSSLRKAVSYIKPELIPDEALSAKFAALQERKSETESAWHALSEHGINAEVVKLARESQALRKGPAKVTPENILLLRRMLVSDNATLSAHGRQIAQVWTSNAKHRSEIAEHMQHKGIHLLPGHFNEESLGRELDRYSAQVDKCLEWIRGMSAKAN